MRRRLRRMWQSAILEVLGPYNKTMSMVGGTLLAATVGLTPNAIVVAVKVRPISRVSAAHGCRAGCTSFSTV